MKKREFLGKFVRELKLDVDIRHYDGGSHEMKFWVRGLTVAEYIDLCEQGFIEKAKPTSSQFLAIGIHTIVDWKGIKQEPTEERIRQLISDDALIDIGTFAFKELTMLSKEEYEKLRGHVKFLHWASQDENEAKAENFNCRTCIKKNIAKRRPCGKFTDEQIEQKRKQFKKEDGEDVDTEEDESVDVSGMMDKYGSKKKFKTKKEAKDYKDKNVVTGNGDVIRVADYNFPECPVSWVDDWLEELGKVLFHCHSHDLSFFENSVANEPYKFYKAQKIVSSTIGEIRSKEMEEQKEDINT